jgi:hypothetical protein
MLRNGNPYSLLVEMSIGKPTMENRMVFCPKIQNRSAIRSRNILLDICPKEIRATCQRNLNTSVLIATLFTIVKI